MSLLCSRLHQSSALDVCLEGTPIEGFAATVVLALAADGAIEDVEVFGDIDTPPTVALSSCLVAELGTVAMPCRPPGIEVLQVGLKIGET